MPQKEKLEATKLRSCRCGIYSAYLRWTSGSDRASNVPVNVTYSAGTDLLQVNQQSNEGQWILLGTYIFNAGIPKKGVSARREIMKLGGKSYWSTTFHNYAVYIGLEKTVYYFNDIEVLRHPANDMSRDYPHCFLINFAIGGGSRWPIDLSRFHEGPDMWVDYVRVYAGEAVPDYFIPIPPVPETEKLPAGTAAVGLNFAMADKPPTKLRLGDETGASGFVQSNWNNLYGSSGSGENVVDHEGQQVPSKGITWNVSGKNAGLVNTWYWGFEGNKRAMHRSALQPEGKLTLTGVPYEKYDVHVYLGAHDLGGAGSVTISSESGKVDPQGTYAYKNACSKSGGNFVAFKAATLEKAEASNYVVFSGNTARTFLWTGKEALRTKAGPGLPQFRLFPDLEFLSKALLTWAMPFVYAACNSFVLDGHQSSRQRLNNVSIFFFCFPVKASGQPTKVRAHGRPRLSGIETA